MKTLINYIQAQHKSDSGDPLVTSMIIIGVMVVVALAVFVALGNAMSDRADDVADDIRNSGTHLGG